MTMQKEFSFDTDSVEAKILNDASIVQDSTIDMTQLLQDAREMKRVLHIRDKNKKDIVEYFEHHIVVDIPIGSEDTLMMDLKQFNNEMYGDEDNLIFDFVPEKKNNIVSEEKTFQLDNDNLSQDKIESLEKTAALNESNWFDESAMDIESLKNDDSTIVITDPLDDINIDNVLNQKAKNIIVESEEDKAKIIANVESKIDDGNYHHIKINRPLTISGRRIHRKLKSLRQKFIDTYGSELFRKVSDLIVEEQNLYNNLDRIDRINRYKQNKSKLAKQMQTKERLRRFFR